MLFKIAVKRTGRTSVNLNRAEIGQSDAVFAYLPTVTSCSKMHESTRQSRILDVSSRAGIADK